MKRIFLAPLLLTIGSTVAAQQSFKLIPPDKSFEVIFPGEPRHEHTSSDSGSGHGEAHSYSFTSAGTRFVLTYFQVSPVPAGVTVDGTLRGVIDGTVENARGKLIAEEPLTVGGRPARKVKISMGDQMVIDGRFVYTKACVYQLLVQHRKGVEPPFEQEFLDSFNVHDVDEGSYRNDYFGFTYKLVSAWEHAPDDLQKGTLQRLQAANPASELLLMIVRPESASAIPDIIVITSVPQQGSNGSGLDQALGYLRSSRQRHPQGEVLRATKPIEMGGIQFARQDERDRGLGQFTAEIALVIKARLLNFAVYSASQQRMEKIAAELVQSVRFDSAPQKGNGSR